MGNMGRYQLPNFTKTSKPPRRPYEKERLDAELKLLGQFGLKNKREIWRVRLILSKTRATARSLLTIDEKDPKRIFEGQALMRRMIRYGILDEDKQRLDYLLNLKVENFLERRLQTLVFKRGLAKSIHHAHWRFNKAKRAVRNDGRTAMKTKVLVRRAARRVKVAIKVATIADERYREAGHH